MSTLGRSGGASVPSSAKRFFNPNTLHLGRLPDPKRKSNAEIWRNLRGEDDEQEYVAKSALRQEGAEKRQDSEKQEGAEKREDSEEPPSPWLDAWQTIKVKPSMENLVTEEAQQSIAEDVVLAAKKDAENVSMENAEPKLPLSQPVSVIRRTPGQPGHPSTMWAPHSSFATNYISQLTVAEPEQEEPLALVVPRKPDRDVFVPNPRRARLSTDHPSLPIRHDRISIFHLHAAIRTATAGHGRNNNSNGNNGQCGGGSSAQNSGASGANQNSSAGCNGNGMVYNCPSNASLNAGGDRLGDGNLSGGYGVVPSGKCGYEAIGSLATGTLPPFCGSLKNNTICDQYSHYYYNASNMNTNWSDLSEFDTGQDGLSMYANPPSPGMYSDFFSTTRECIESAYCKDPNANICTYSEPPLMDSDFDELARATAEFTNSDHLSDIKPGHHKLYSCDLPANVPSNSESSPTFIKVEAEEEIPLQPATNSNTSLLPTSASADSSSKEVPVDFGFQQAFPSFIFGKIASLPDSLISPGALDGFHDYRTTTERDSNSSGLSPNGSLHGSVSPDSLHHQASTTTSVEEKLRDTVLSTYKKNVPLSAQHSASLPMIISKLGLTADGKPIEFVNGGHGIKNPKAALVSAPLIQKGDLVKVPQSEVKSKGNSFACPTCSKAFRLQRLLNRHLKCHSNQKRYLCSFCGKGFNDTFDLKRHTRTHTGVRPYKCNLCEKSFTQRCSLESHCLKVHGQNHTYAYKERRTKMYVCEECGHTTNQSENHYMHLKMKHPRSPALLKFYDKRHFKFTDSRFANLLLSAPQ